MMDDFTQIADRKLRAGYVTRKALRSHCSSDFNKEVIRAYRVVLEDLYGMHDLAKRAVFVVDTGRIVRYREVLTSARELPDYARLKQALADL